MGDLAYLDSERVFYRASAVETAKPAVVKSVTAGGVLQVVVDGNKAKIEVPDAKSSLARRFAEHERVLVTPDGKIEIGKKDNTPKGTSAVVTDVDVSVWPPTYMIKEDGKPGHRQGVARNMVATTLALLVAADEAASELLEKEEKEALARDAVAEMKAQKQAAKRAAAEEKAREEREQTTAMGAETQAETSGLSAPPGFAKAPPGFELAGDASATAQAREVAVAKADAKAKARETQETAKASRAAAEKDAKNKAKRDAQRARKAADAAGRAVVEKEEAVAEAIRDKEEAVAKEIQDTEEAAARAIREKGAAADAKQAAAFAEKRRRKLSQELANEVEKNARAANELASKKACLAVRACAEETDGAKKETRTREANEAALAKARAQQELAIAATNALLAAKSTAQRAKLLEKERKKQARRVEIDRALRDLGADDDLLALVTPGGVARAHVTEEDEPGATAGGRRKNANAASRKKRKSQTQKDKKKREGGRLTGAAETALQEEAAGSSDLALVYVVCLGLFALLAAVAVWAYTNLL